MICNVKTVADPIPDPSTLTTPRDTRAPGIPYFTPSNNPGAALHPNDPSTLTLFRPLKIRDVTLKNRVIVAPMCMFSSEPDPTSPAVGALTDFHIAHLGHLATKGVALIFIEATGVSPTARISPQDSGLWQDGPQVEGIRRLVNLAHSQGAKVGIQLAHAGRKGSTVAPWLTREWEGSKIRGSIKADVDGDGWPDDVVAPSGGEEFKWAPGEFKFWAPREPSVDEIQKIVGDFAESAKLAVKAGVDVIEVHGAHGYLLHEFLSPVTNKRTDKYGGSFENRARFLREVCSAIRQVIPEGMPLFLRISATEWLDATVPGAEEGSWDIESSIRLAGLLPEWSVDFLDVSSGGNHKDQKILPHSKYQITFAGQLRKEIKAAGQKTLVGAVGLVTEAEAARDIVQGADEEEEEPLGDAVLIGRQFLREPGWVMNAAKKLGVPVSLPLQFGRVLAS